MLYKGYKILVRCIDWKQIKLLDKYLSVFTKYVKAEKVIGLGMNWSKDYLYSEYAIGVIDDKKTLEKIKQIDFSNTMFKPKYFEIVLPDIEEWETFKGHASNLKNIYEKDVQCYERSYDYELEYIDSDDNIEIKIHFVDD